jgi:hypothetical protein
MHLIWYNSDSKKYKFGKRSTYNTETQQSLNPDSFTILMVMESAFQALASKIIKQLNIAVNMPFIQAS